MRNTTRYCFLLETQLREHTLWCHLNQFLLLCCVPELLTSSGMYAIIAIMRNQWQTSNFLVAIYDKTTAVLLSYLRSPVVNGHFYPKKQFQKRS